MKAHVFISITKQKKLYATHKAKEVYVLYILNERIAERSIMEKPRYNDPKKHVNIRDP